MSRELEEIWRNMYQQQHYMLPYSSGDWMVYHHGPPSFTFNEPYVNYEIIRPRKFRLKLYYLDNLIKLSKDKPFNYSDYTLNRNKEFIEIPYEINLKEFFVFVEYKDCQIPSALKRFETEYKVERIFSLLAFS